MTEAYIHQSKHLEHGSALPPPVHWHVQYFPRILLTICIFFVVVKNQSILPIFFQDSFPIVFREEPDGGNH